MSTKPKDFVLVLRPMSGNYPGTVDARIRKGLKLLGRHLGLRCVKITEQEGK